MLCHTPMLLGALTSSWPAEKWVDDEKSRKITKKIKASTCGFRDSPGPPPSVDALGYVPAHRQGERNGRQVWYFSYFFNGIQTHRPSGAIRSEYSPDRGVQWLRVKPWTPSIVYWAISSVSCRRISSSVETARTAVHLFVADDRAIDLNLANWHSKTFFKLELKRRRINYIIIGIFV